MHKTTYKKEKLEELGRLKFTDLPKPVIEPLYWNTDVFTEKDGAQKA